MADVDFPGAVWKGAYRGNFSHGRNGLMPVAAADHIMQGILTGTDSWFQSPAAGTSTHFGIGHDESGALTVHQYVRVEDTAFSNGNVLKPNLAAVPWLGTKENYRGATGRINANYRTISIEHEGKHPLKIGNTLVVAWQMPPEIYYLSLDLHIWLRDHFNIEPRRDRVTRHSDYDSVNKGWCPGPGFPMANLLGDLGDREFAAYKGKIPRPKLIVMGWSRHEEARKL
jgi:hypothetical protein